ncbi:hypothetical protein JCM19237_5219 [Photobacterium aphoticum]|uniref:Uncharacterized protein n=1 Tax=Photobacterium aphoticum TaxID=754436 RepID=A0A090QHB2_9GAMM|nr:hypothetical protein JCM19237_5219 [Photobacterium aphoticum]
MRMPEENRHAGCRLGLSISIVSYCHFVDSDGESDEAIAFAA